MNSRIIIYIDICFNVDSWFSWKLLQFCCFNFIGFDIILRPAIVGMYVVLEYVLMSWLIMIKSVLEFWRCYLVLFSFCFLSTSLFEVLLVKSFMLAWFREVTKNFEIIDLQCQRCFEMVYECLILPCMVYRNLVFVS